MNIYLVGISISFVAYLVLGFFISKRVKNANDFFVSGRNAPVILIVGSMIASYVSTGMFMGDAGEYYNGLFSPMTILATMQVAGYIVGAVFFGKYLRRAEVVTIPEFFGMRFCSSKMHKLATITSLITIVVYLLSVMQGVGTLMSLVTGLSYRLCVILSLIVFAFISITSGAKGVLITDTIMFGFFTIALIVSTLIIANKNGGWYSTVERLQELNINGLLSWGGNTDYLYSTGLENVSWGIIYGIVWLSVCMVGPWQSSRYIMAKNEHTVIRSSIFSAFGIFLLQLLVGISAVSVNLYDAKLESSSHVMIWAAKELLPTFIGVLLLTGVLAAGISSATTFLSLVGTSVANDIFKNKGKPMLIGKLSMVAVCAIVLLLDYFNSPQIFWIMFFGGAIVAASWMPVAVASIFSKRITKCGAFCGMLFGFLGCFISKLYFSISGTVFPVYLEPTLIGMAANILAMIVGSSLTKVSQKERETRALLFVVPEKEKDEKEVVKTIKYMKFAPLLGLVVFLILLFVWVVPYVKAIV